MTSEAIIADARRQRTEEVQTAVDRLEALQVGAEEHRKAGDVLAVDLEHRLLDPPASEAHPRAALAQRQRRRAGIDRLLEEETGLPVLIAEDPLTCVARGGGRALEMLDERGGELLFALD